MKILSRVILFSLILGIAGIAHATSYSFSNRTDWNSAVVSPTTLGFTGVGGTSELVYSSPLFLNYGGFNFTNSGGLVVGVAAAVTSDAAYHTSDYLEWEQRSNNANTLSVVKSSGSINAVAFDYGMFHNQAGVNFIIKLDNGDTFNLLTADNAYAFFGIVSDNPFSSFSISAGLYPTIDNLSYGNGTAPVPEPATFLLLGAGLVGACLLRKRMRK